MIQRVPCRECGAEILLTTAESTGGICMACVQGIRGNLKIAEDYYLTQREKEAAYEPFRTSDLIRTEPVRRPEDLAGRETVSLPMVPRHGLGPFLLDSPREKVREVMAQAGLPLESEEPTMDYCCASALQFEYDETGKLQFIGASHDERLNITWAGRDVFDIPAHELFDLINAGESSPVEFNSYDPFFPTQISTLWDADEQYDYRGEHSRPVWAQVGLGNQVYYAYRVGNR